MSTNLFTLTVLLLLSALAPALCGPYSASDCESVGAGCVVCGSWPNCGFDSKELCPSEFPAFVCHACNHGAECFGQRGCVSGYKGVCCKSMEAAYDFKAYGVFGADGVGKCKNK